MPHTNDAKGGWLQQVHRLFFVGTVGALADGQLLERFVSDGGEDSQAAFEELMHRHGPMVLRVCREMLGDMTSAEDAFQATFLVLAQRAGSIRRRDSVSSWLFGVARRVAAHSRLCAAQRRAGERHVAEQTPEARIPREPESDCQTLLAELERLPQPLRAVVVLCYLEGLTYEMAGQRLGLSEGAIRGRLARARNQLRRRLTRDGATIPAGFFTAGNVVQPHLAQPFDVGAPLVDSTIRIAMGVNVGAAPTALARGVLRSMLWSKLRAAAVVTVAAMGTSLLAWQARAARDDKAGEAPLSTPSPTAARSRGTTPGGEPPPRNIQPYRGTVEVRDLLTDAPVPGTRVESSYAGGPKIVATTDAKGTAPLVIPGFGESYYLNIRVSRMGLVPLLISWSRTGQSATPPDRFRFRTEKGVTIGGRVLDQDRRPVPGANVIINARKRYPDSEQMADVSFVRTKTGADGRWSVSNVPEHADAVDIGTYHHLYLSDRTFFPVEEFQPLSALRDGSATFKLRSGTRIDGTVLDPDGRPVPDAAVLYGDEDSRTVNRVPAVTTDSQGRFTLGIVPGAISVLTAQRAGFGPVIQTVRVGEEAQRVTLKLEPPHNLGGRVANSAGRPVSQATVSVQSWHGSESLAWTVQTDKEGRFLWKDAPGDPVQVRVSAQGYIEKREVPLSPGADNQIVLASPVLVKGTVVDSQTSQPIRNFSLVHGTVWNRGRHLIWQRNGHVDQLARKGPGSFEFTFRNQVHELDVRVEAEGYLPADSGPFAPDGASRAFTFRLVKADPIRGTVLNPDGAPARNGFMYLVLAGDGLELVNGDVPVHQREYKIHAQISSGGLFRLPPQKDDWKLVVLSDAGFAEVRRRDLSSNNTVRLQPWAIIAGTVKLGTRTASELELRLQPKDEDPPGHEDEPRIIHQVEFTTNTDGRFELARVVPGHYDVIRVVPNGVRRVTFIKMAALDLAAGRSQDVTIGGRGRPVTGRLKIDADVQWMVRNAVIEPKFAIARRDERGVQISPDGRFRADNTEPGNYKLRIGIHEPPPEDACGWGRLLGEYVREFTVSTIPARVSDDPLDLGEIARVPLNSHLLQIGDLAPDFHVKTLGGQDLRLADFKGKFVLLDFWATWCAPCVAEIPNLKAVHETFAADPRLEIVSLSLDEGETELKMFLKSQKLPWAQALIGPDSPVAAAYAATAIPSTFLIGPDGRIIATGLRSDKIKASVAQALGW